MRSLEGTEWILGKSNPKSSASKGHKSAVSIIKSEFPGTVIHEEVAIKISDKDKSKQFLDLYLPFYSLVIEYHGRQHFEYVKHFHKNKRGFLKAQHRDRQKKLWCDINNLELVELFYNESEDSWREKIVRAIKP